MRTTKNNKRGSTAVIIRHIIQLAAFIAFPGMFITVFGALKSVVTAAAGGTFTFSAMAGPLFIIVSVLLLTMLWGRFFCGWLCSFGAMDDLIYGLSDRILPFAVEIPQKAERWLKGIKYLILIYLAGAVWILGMPFSSSISPWNAFGLLTSWNLTSAQNAVKTTGFILLLLIAAGSFLIERFFCRYLCPLGAVFALLSHTRLFKIKRKENSCVHCSLCNQKCSMGLNVMNTESVASSECIDCMNCLRACPADALSANPHPAAAGTAAAIAAAGLITVGNVEIPKFISTSASSYSQSYGSGSSDSSGNSSSSGSSGSSDSSAKGKFKDGTYEGSGTGYRGTTRVKVTVKNGKITDITVESYEDDDQFFSRAQSTVIDEILSAQSIDVDTVSGATYSSNGILEAVADALGISFDNPNSSSGGENGRR